MDSIKQHFQLKLLEGDLAKHHMATKNLQAQIRAVEAEVKTYEAESVRIADENQVLSLTSLQ